MIKSYIINMHARKPMTPAHDNSSHRDEKKPIKPTWRQKFQRHNHEVQEDFEDKDKKRKPRSYQPKQRGGCTNNSSNMLS